MQLYLRMESKLGVRRYQSLYLHIVIFEGDIDDKYEGERIVSEIKYGKR